MTAVTPGTTAGPLTGARVRRKEDPRILTGRGRYVDDIHGAGMLHAAFVRSVEAHGRLTRVDTDLARKTPGVVAVLTASDLVDDIVPLNFGPSVEGMAVPPYTALASDKVRFVGDPIAIVVAENRYAAEDGAAQVEVEVERMPVIVTADQAVRPGAPRVHAAAPGNVLYHHEESTAGVVDAAARAAHVVRYRLNGHRWAPVPIETRGGVADYDPSTRMLTYEVATQSPHLARQVLAIALNHPQQSIRVLARDVGGGFGLKWMPVREEITLCAAARKLAATIKWIEDRNENLVSGGHARDEAIDVEFAVDADGRILSLTADMTMNVGAFAPVMYGASTTTLMRCMLPGPYRIPQYRSSERIVFSNTGPFVTLRGPWGSETLARERALDRIARVVGVSPVEIRRRNLVPLAEQPFDSPAGYVLDGVTAENTFRRAVELVDYERTVSELTLARAAGRVVGFGIATFIEPAPGTPELWGIRNSPLPGEHMRAAIESDGTLTLFTQQMPHGQSHETTIAQVAADEFGIAFDQVRLVFGDTQVTPFGLIGTGGSRAATMATGSALLATQAVKEKVLDIAAAVLEVSADDLRIEGGMVHVAGDPDAGVSVADIARRAYMAAHTLPPDLDLDLQATRFYDGERGGFAQATHCCWVEIDPETGLIEIVRYLAVDDSGKLINPAVVEGQVRGAITMGIGGMLYEKVEYDQDGNCQSGTFLDYLLPTPPELPDFELEHIEFASDKLVSSRGVGEGGTVLAPAAVLNAVEDAVLAAGGSPITETPLTPTRVLELLGVIHRDQT